MERIGPYELRRELGRGSLGVVYQARDPALDRDVAVKVLLLPSDKGRFEREALAVARLRHPNVVSVHGMGEHQRRTYLVMELIEGVSLAKHLEAGPLEARQAASLTRALADAVQAAHEEGILHRDLRPGNVLLEGDSNPVLVDFGLAQLAGLERRISGEVQGTPAYLAPEQARGEVDAVGVGTDVHGLGAILYAALSGRAPFEGETLVDVLTAVAEARPRPPGQLRPGIDRELELICLRCLEKDPARRFLTAGALRDALDEWLAPKAAHVSSRGFLALGVTGVALGMALGGVSWAATRRAAVPPAPPLAAAVPDEPSPPREEPRPTPSPQKRALKLMESVHAAMTLGRSDDCLELIDQVLVLDPDLSEAYFLRASVLFLRGQRSQALADLDRGLVLEPDNLAGRLNCARARFSLGDHAGGMAELEDYFERGGDRAQGLLVRSAASRAVGKMQEALRDLDAAVALRPDDGEVRGIRGDTLLAVGETNRAIVDLERAVATPEGARIPQVWAALGRANQLLGRFDRSLDAYGRAADAGYSLVEARLGQAIDLYELKRREEALAAVEEALALQPELAWGRALRGIVLYEGGRKVESRADLEAALRGPNRLPQDIADKIQRYLAALETSRPAPPSGR